MYRCTTGGWVPGCWLGVGDVYCRGSGGSLSSSDLGCVQDKLLDVPLYYMWVGGDLLLGCGQYLWVTLVTPTR